MTKPTPSLSAEAVVVCDDIRQEDNQKVILIGVYNNTIIVNNFPTVLLFKYWIQCKAAADGDIPIKMRIFKDNNKKLFHAELNLHVKRGAGGYFAFSLHSPPITFDAPCSLILKWQRPSQRWEKLIEMIVSKA